MPLPPTALAPPSPCGSSPGYAVPVSAASETAAQPPSPPTEAELLILEEMLSVALAAVGKEQPRNPLAGVNLLRMLSAYEVVLQRCACSSAACRWRASASAQPRACAQARHRPCRGHALLPAAAPAVAPPAAKLARQARRAALAARGLGPYRAAAALGHEQLSPGGQRWRRRAGLHEQARRLQSTRWLQRTGQPAQASAARLPIRSPLSPGHGGAAGMAHRLATGAAGGYIPARESEAVGGAAHARGHATQLRAALRFDARRMRPAEAEAATLEFRLCAVTFRAWRALSIAGQAEQKAFKGAVARWLLAVSFWEQVCDRQRPSPLPSTPTCCASAPRLVRRSFAGGS